jgi:hypothetical protein
MGITVEVMNVTKLKPDSETFLHIRRAQESAARMHSSQKQRELVTLLAAALAAVNAYDTEDDS